MRFIFKLTTTIVLLFVAVLPCWAITTASIQPTGDYDPNHCGFWGDGKTLMVKLVSGPAIKYNFCSAYGKSTVHVITDSIGNTYVLLEYGKGHGTNATSEYLEILKVSGDALIGRGHELLSEPAGLFSDWMYTYTVSRPAAGGLAMVFKLKQEGPNSPGMLPPPIDKKIILIDVIR